MKHEESTLLTKKALAASLKKSMEKKPLKKNYSQRNHH